MIGPSCDIPPDAPEEGTKLYIPKIFDMEYDNQCAVDGEVLAFTCPSFMSVYLRSAAYGRTIEAGKTLCNGQTDSPVAEDCQTEAILPQLRTQCHGQSSCSFAVSANLTETASECLLEQRNQLNISYSCGKNYQINDLIV